MVCCVGRDTQEFMGRRALWAEAPGSYEPEVSVAQGIWKVRGTPRPRGLCSFSASVSAWGLAVLVIDVVDLSPRMFLNLRCGFHFLGAETFRARCREEGWGLGLRSQPRKETKTVAPPWDRTVLRGRARLCFPDLPVF